MIEGLTYYCDKQRHLVCVPYTIENLHKMAADLGIHRGWFDPEPKYPHYDFPIRRMKEIMSKCVVVRPREILAIIKGETLVKVVDIPSSQMQTRKIRYRR